MWWAIGKAIVMMIVSSVTTAMMAPKPEKPKAGTLEVPTAEEGGPIPVVFGTVVIKASTVVWTGDAKTKPIMSKGGKK